MTFLVLDDTMDELEIVQFFWFTISYNSRGPYENLMNFAIHQRENVNILIIINNINNKVGEYMLTLDLKQTQAQVFRQEMQWPSSNRSSKAKI